jgi:hypothetical protein
MLYYEFCHSVQHAVVSGNLAKLTNLWERRTSVLFSLGEVLRDDHKAFTCMSMHGVDERNILHRWFVDSFNQACTSGHITVIEWIFNNMNYRGDCITPFISACVHGQLDAATTIMCFKVSQNPIWVSSVRRHIMATLPKVAKNGHLHIIDWIGYEFELKNKDWYTLTPGYTILKNNKVISKISNLWFVVFMNACLGKHVHIIKWVCETILAAPPSHKILPLSKIDTSYLIWQACLQNYSNIPQFIVDMFKLTADDTKHCKNIGLNFSEDRIFITTNDLIA